jgi:hypothetical protein
MYVSSDMSRLFHRLLRAAAVASRTLEKAVTTNEGEKAPSHHRQLFLLPYPVVLGPDFLRDSSLLSIQDNR